MRFLADHDKPNHKLRRRVVQMIRDTNFGTEHKPDYGCFDVDDLSDGRFVAGLLGEFDVLLACAVLKPQPFTIRSDKTRSDFLSGFCVDAAVRKGGLARILHDHICADAKARYPTATQHHIVLDAERHNWPFWVDKMGYILLPDGCGSSSVSSFMRRTW